MFSRTRAIQLVAVYVGLVLMSGIGAVESVPPGTGTGLLAEYYNNMDYTGGVVRRIDATVDRVLAVDAVPVADIEPKTYSIVWTGRVQALTTELYTIATKADDGVQVWIDGDCVIHNAGLNYDATVIRRHQATRAFTAGSFHDIKVLYYQNRGTAAIQLLWSTPTIAEQIIPRSQLYVVAPAPVTILPAGAGTGLRAHYFNNQNFTGGMVERTDATVDFAWGTSAPVPEIDAGSLSVVWRGMLTPRSSETYTISTLADDGVQVLIDGVSLINQQNLNYDSTVVRRSGAPIAFVAGSARTIEVRYNQQRANATMRLLWSSPNIPEEVIPQSQLAVIPPDPVAFSPVGSGAGLRAQYFNNWEFTGGTITRVDPTIDFAWGSNDPALDIDAGYYSVIWTGRLRPRTTERYYLTTQADDGLEVLIDGSRVIQDQSLNYDATKVRRNSVPLDLVADVERTIEVRYYQQRANATMRLLWSSPNVPEEVIPQSQLFVIPPATATLSPPGTGTGLHARYWNNQNFSGGMVERVDPTLDFTWPTGQSPAPDIEGSSFAITWEGKIRARSTERYTITTRTDDGVRVVVDGVTVINDGSLNYDTSKVRRNSASFAWEADSEHTVEIRYYQQRATGTMQLLWSTPTIAEEVIPQSQLYVIPPVLATLSPPGNGVGLCSRWFANADFTGQVAQHIDPVVDHTWGVGVEPKPGMGGTYYSVLWRGVLQARSSERYYLSTLSDDSVRLVIDGQTVVDDQRNNYDGTTIRRNTVPLDFTADSQHTIEIWYAQNRGTGRLTLLWSTATIAEEVVPASQLFPPPSAGAQITWPTPASIVYGTALSAAQLNASAGIPGAFSYNPAPGTLLVAGTHTLSVLFVPSDQTSCASASATVDLIVTPATPVVTWATPAPIIWGTPLNGSSRTATANVPGSFAYAPEIGTVLEVGAQPLTAVFTPEDAANYLTVNAQVLLNVQPVPTTLTWLPPSSIIYGTALSATQLSAVASADGTITYDPPAGTILEVGTRTLTATFTPADPHFASAQTTVDITVTKVIPTIAWANPVEITYGTALSASQLNATATVPGSFVYSPAVDALLGAGVHTLSVTFTPTDTAHYTAAQATTTLTVAPATPTIIWATPAPITDATALSTAQLNATASVSGSFVYTPAAGALLAAGTQALTVSFTPTDGRNYTTATATVAVVVTSAGGGGDPGEAPALPTPTIAVAAGSLTGDRQYTNDDGRTIFLSNRETIAFTVGVPASGWAVVATGVEGGEAADPLSAKLPEGLQEVRGWARLAWQGREQIQSSAPILVHADRTPPAVTWIVPGTTDEALAIVSDGGRNDFVRLNGATAAENETMRSLYGWRCWPKAGFSLSARVSDASGVRDEGAPQASVGNVALVATAAAGGDGQPMLTLQGFAEAPDAVTVNGDDLTFTPSAGLQALHLRLEDRCGNVLDADQFQMWIKAQASIARLGYLPVARNAIATGVGIIPPGGDTDYSRATLLATPADVAAVLQLASAAATTGTVARRLSAGPLAITGMTEAQPVLWLLPQALTAAVPASQGSFAAGAQDASDKRMRGWFRTVDMAGNISAVQEITAYSREFELGTPPASSTVILVPGVDMDEAVVERTRQWGAAYSWEDPSGAPENPDNTGGIGVLASLNRYQDLTFGTVAAHTYGVLPLTRLIETPVWGISDLDLLYVDADEVAHRSSVRGDGGTSASYVGSYNPADPVGVNNDVFNGGHESDFEFFVMQSEPPLGTEVGIFAGADQIAKGYAFEVFEDHLGGGTDEEWGYQWEWDDLYNYSAFVDISYNSNVPIADGSYVWGKPLCERTPCFTLPASWDATARHAEVGPARGTGLAFPAVSEHPALPTEAGTGTETLRFGLSRDLPGGLVRLPWHADAGHWQPFGYGAANLIKVEHDVQLAGTSSTVVIDGYFAALPFPGATTPAAPTPACIEVRLAELRVQAETALAAWPTQADVGTLRSRATLLSSWIGSLANDSARPDVPARVIRLAYAVRHADAVSLPQTAAIKTWHTAILASAPDASKLTAHLAAADIDARMGEIAAKEVVFGDIEAQLAQKHGQTSAWDPALSVNLLQAAIDLAQRRLALVERAVAGWEAYWAAARTDMEQLDATIAQLYAAVNDGGAYDQAQAIIERVTAADQPGAPLEEPRLIEDYFPFPSGYWEARDAADTMAAAIRSGPDYQAAQAVWNHAWYNARPIANWIATRPEPIADAFAKQSTTGAELPIDAWITVEAVILRMDEVASPLVQKLDVRMRMGADAVGLYDIGVNFGAVHAYPDELSQQYAGANGAHRMKEALAVVKMEYVTPDKLDISTDEYNWAIVPGNPTNTAVIATSNPSPEIQIDETNLQQAYMRNGTVFIKVSGNVIDPSFDNAPIGADEEIAEIGLYDTEGYQIAVTNLVRNQQYAGSPKGYFAQHPYMANFDFGTIAFNKMSKNCETIVLKTSQNGIGNCGILPIRVVTGRAPIDGAEIDARTGQCVIPLTVTNSEYPNSLGMKIGNGSVIELRRDGQNGSIFVGDNGCALIVNSLSTEVLDGVLRLAIFGGSTQYSAVLRYDAEDAAYHGGVVVNNMVPDAAGKPSVSILGKVSSYPQTKRGSYFPFTVRVAVPPAFSIDDFQFNIGGVDLADWNLKEDGYYYPTGPSRKIYIVVIRNGEYRLRAYDENGLVGDWPLDKVAISSSNPNGFKNVTFKGRFKESHLGVDAIQVNHVFSLGQRADQNPSQDPSSNSSINYKLYNSASTEAAGTCRVIAYVRSQLLPLIKTIPGYTYGYPGSYTQDLGFLYWLKGKYDAGELKSVPTSITLKVESGISPYSITERVGTLEDMKPIVKDMIEQCIPALMALGTTNVGSVSAISIYNSSIGRIADSDELFEYVWYVDKMPIFKEAADWAGVPVDCLYAGIISETQDDSLASVVGETPGVVTLLGELVFRKRTSGIGIANIYFAQPYEDRTGMYISDILQRQPCPDASLAVNWETYKNRDVFQEVCTHIRPSVLIYAAMWRATVEALNRGNPTRYPSGLLGNINADAWNKEDGIDFGHLKASLSNAVMMSIEQYTVGFDKSGNRTSEIDMRIADLLGPNGVKNPINLFYLNKSLDDKRLHEPLDFVTNTYNDAVKRVKAYREVYDGMVGP